jgi:hypothetical protein
VTLWQDESLSVNPLPLANQPQADEDDLAPHFRLNGLSAEPDLPAKPRLVARIELAKVVELQRESIRAQIIQQSGLQARDDRVYDVLGFFLGRQ